MTRRRKRARRERRQVGSIESQLAPLACEAFDNLTAHRDAGPAHDTERAQWLAEWSRK